MPDSINADASSWSIGGRRAQSGGRTRVWGQAQKNCVIPQKNCVIFQKTKTGCGDRTALKLTWAQKNCEQFLETQLEQSQNYYSAKKLRIVFKNQSRIRPIWVLHLHYKAHYGKNFSKNFWRNSILFT